MPLCIFGIIGNIISIAVWLRFIHKKIGTTPSSAMFFVALGFADSGLLIFFLLTDSIPKAVGPAMSNSYAFGWFYAYIGFPFFFFFIVASIWMVVGIAVNRLVVVRFPIKARYHCTKERTYIAIGLILAFCFIINFPHFFNFKPVHADGRSQYIETDYAKKGSAQNYEFWVHCMFLVLFPWGSIAIINAWIISALFYNTKKFRDIEMDPKKVAEREQQDRQITRTLLMVTFTFLILLAWQCINQCFFMLKYGKTSKGQKWQMVEETYAFAKLGVVVNSSINCILYCFSGPTFRKELRRVFVRSDDTTTTQRSSTPYNAATV